MDFTSLLSRLQNELLAEYKAILLPFGLERFASDLAGGKFLRSRLLAVAAGSDAERVIGRCVALEMLHTFTLVHDDIIDQAQLRRNRPTLWHALGTDQALLIGNLIAARALMIAVEDSADLGKAFLRAFTIVNQAQQLEVQARGKIKTDDEYIAILSGKTSAMFELALYSGASLSAEWPRDLDNLTDAMSEVGVVFQVIDDVEDVEAWLKRDVSSRSKAAEFDIELENYNLPVALAVRKAKVQPDKHGKVDASSIHEITSDVWQYSFILSRQHADKHIVKAQSHLRQAEQNDATELVSRVKRWSGDFLLRIRDQPLDTATKKDA